MKIKTKIKIVRRQLNVSQITPPTDEPVVGYDIYEGFTGFPSTWPFMTKWILDKAGLTEDEMVKYVRYYLTAYRDTSCKVIVRDVGICR